MSCHQTTKMTKIMKKKMSTPKIFIISHRFDVTDWKYFTSSAWAASTLKCASSTFASILHVSHTNKSLNNICLFLNSHKQWQPERRQCLSWTLVYITGMLVQPFKEQRCQIVTFKVFSAIQVEPTFLISDIRALWRSGLSARVPECQKFIMQVRAGWPSITSWHLCPLKG